MRLNYATCMMTAQNALESYLEQPGKDSLSFLFASIAYTAQADALVEPFSPESLAAAKLRKEAQDLIRDLDTEDA